MKTQSNTYSAGAIMDYLPDFIKNVMEDLTIYPEHEDTEHRGGISFILTVNDVSLRYKVIHNFGDLFDVYAYNPETGQLVEERNDLFFGDFINLWDIGGFVYTVFEQYFEEE